MFRLWTEGDSHAYAILPYANYPYATGYWPYELRVRLQKTRNDFKAALWELPQTGFRFPRRSVSHQTQLARPLGRYPSPEAARDAANAWVAALMLRHGWEPNTESL